MGQHVRQFRRIAGVGKRQKGVCGRHHAQIAMARFSRMNELGRRAGRSHGGGDLVANMATLAHTGHDDAPADTGEQFDRFGELPSDLVSHQRQRLALDLHDAAGDLDGLKALR
jgi:hypothetical protein